ncbi:unnamed protein product [Porites lobata]|uniref:Glycosyl hydrolases family 22 (GH22) domain-containing protein n=1 Tax=Porites lobata TaxID=104759 RepID=A0ABN8QQJ9_9CNID|nr:unnamed protein product [Porites lobata]
MKTLTIFIFVMGTLAFGGMANAGYLSKCAVVRSLRSYNVPESEMRDWLCLVKHESNFQYNAVNDANRDGSKDYGIYQINSNYWCDQPDNTKYSRCWQIRSHGCGYPCSAFLDSDIGEDTDCAVKIRRCQGFSAWYAWRDNCQGRDLTSDRDYDFSRC